MKKLLTGIAAAALTLSLCSTPALAACHGNGHGCTGAYKNSYYKASCQFVDKNSDGICDNYTTGASKGCHKGHCRRGC